MCLFAKMGKWTKAAGVWRSEGACQLADGVWCHVCPGFAAEVCDLPEPNAIRHVPYFARLTNPHHIGTCTHPIRDLVRYANSDPNMHQK